MINEEVYKIVSGTVVLWFREVNTGQLEIEIYDSHEPNMPTGSIAAYISPAQAREFSKKLKVWAERPAQSGRREKINAL